MAHFLFVPRSSLPLLPRHISLSDFREMAFLRKVFIGGAGPTCASDARGGFADRAVEGECFPPQG